MTCLPILAMFTASYAEWKKANKKEDKNPGKRADGKDKAKGGRMTVAAPVEGDPSRGVRSFGSMMRASGSAPAKPPSIVGSLRSFTSVATMEEQVEGLDSRLQQVEEHQERTDKKLDQILELLQANRPSGQKDK